MKDLNYLLGYLLPASVILGFILGGYVSFLTPIVAFVLVPVLELILPLRTSNLNEEMALKRGAKNSYDLLLYINVPLMFGMIGYFLWNLSINAFSSCEIIGFTLSVGIAQGSNGINVAHELGHRKKSWERGLGKLLLLPSLYQHFYIDHNYGHHVDVGTEGDATTAKLNQSVYGFWIQAVTGEYLNAWRIQISLLKREGKAIFSIKNDMLIYQFCMLTYLLSIQYFFGYRPLLAAVAIAIISFLLLETINYIEHYGLRRLKTDSGRYERVREVHSWNSNHIMGRMMLYELTRHSDHHHRAHKKYQLLDYWESSPQLPFGYPTSMVLSLIPPLWFSIMNPRIPSEMK